jgi:hypothetical protein
MNSQNTRHARRTQDDFTTEIRTKLCGFAVTPTEAMRIRHKADAKQLSISCLVREALRKADIL